MEAITTNVVRIAKPKVLVTGVAGFIGSHLLEALLNRGYKVVGLDNFSTGSPKNLEEVERKVDKKLFKNFKFIRGSVSNIKDCSDALKDVEVVLHQAALGSVPRSFAHPLDTNESNVTGFLTLLTLAKNMGVNRFIYASSSSVYGSSPELPKVEDKVGDVLSPYAATKKMNEMYASVFASNTFETIGLRYFNVFGPRQNPHGPYSAVIPRWIEALHIDKPLMINGSFNISRDFTHVSNVVEANLLAMTAPNLISVNNIYNVSCGDNIPLSEVLANIASHYNFYDKEIRIKMGLYRDGDIMHSCADITKIRNELGYEVKTTFSEGIKDTLMWYDEFYNKGRKNV